MSPIPKVSVPKLNNKIKPDIPVQRSIDGISFSFEALETTEYFNLDATCANWSSELFEMLKQVSAVNKPDLMSGVYKKYRIHNHENASPPSKLPDGVQLKDCYQLRISKSKGGIHGVFVENIFYVIWLDPLHNMYPNEHYGGLRKIKPPTTCCKDRDKIIDELNKKIQELSFYKEYYMFEQNDSSKKL